MADIVVMTALALLGERLVVSEEAIEYRGIGLWVRASWDDVTDIATTAYGPSKAEALLLQFPMPEIAWWYKMGTTTSVLSKMESVAEGDVRELFGEWKVETPGDAIPIGAMQKNWREGRLGDDLRKYAPHLFDADARRTQKERLANRPRWEKQNTFQPRPGRWISPLAWVAVIVIELVVCIWLLPILIAR